MMIREPTSATKQACKQSAIEATISSYKYISPLDLIALALALSVVKDRRGGHDLSDPGYWMQRQKSAN